MSFHYDPVTIAFLVVGVFVIAAFDIWRLSKGYDHTISQTLRVACHAWPVLAFIGGFFGAHLFFSQPCIHAAAPDPSHHCPEATTPWTSGNAVCWCEATGTQCVGMDVP